MKPYFSLKLELLIIMLLVISANGMAQVLTNVYVKKTANISKVLAKENSRFIIRDSFDLRNKEVKIGANSILDFQGGSISNGIIKGNKTLVIGTPYNIFNEIELQGSFRGESYPEWFNGDIQKCVDHFKITRFVDDEYVIIKPLNLQFGSKLEGSGYNVLRFCMPSEYDGKGCINVGAYCEVSNFIVFVGSNNPAIEIKSSYVSSSMANSEYMQRIAPETTSPGAGSSAAINIHDLTVRTALPEIKGDKKSTVCSTTPAIWLTSGGGYYSYDRDARMYRITEAPGMWGIKFSNIDISGRWLIGIKCEQINESVSNDEIKKLEMVTQDHEPFNHYWVSHNEKIINSLKKGHKWGYGWITGCVFENIKIHSVIGGIWLGREHKSDGNVISRGTSIQHFIFSNIQMQYWCRRNADNSINIGSQYFVKLNNCNGITFTNCEPWDWPITSNGVEKPFQIDDSFNVWNITFQGYSQWNSTTTNFIQYENGSKMPLCNEHRVVSSIPESSFGMGNVAILDDYLDYSHYDTNIPESMKCNKQLRLLPPGTYSIPNINNTILKEFFKIDIVQNYLINGEITDAWLDIRLVADASSAIGTQYMRIVTIHFCCGGKLFQKTLRKDGPKDTALQYTDWY